LIPAAPAAVGRFPADGIVEGPQVGKAVTGEPKQRGRGGRFLSYGRNRRNHDHVAVANREIHNCVQRAHDGGIQVQKERLAAGDEAGLEEADLLPPSAITRAGRLDGVKSRESTRLLGEHDESVGTGEISGNTPAEVVDVAGCKFTSPMDADDGQVVRTRL
jgi:hypothetical protein